MPAVIGEIHAMLQRWGRLERDVGSAAAAAAGATGAANAADSAAANLMHDFASGLAVLAGNGAAAAAALTSLA